MAGNVKRIPNPASARKKGFDWKTCLIESVIVIVVFNVIAWVVTWYFILPHLKR